jgi:hypothetical protein
MRGIISSLVVLVLLLAGSAFAQEADTIPPALPRGVSVGSEGLNALTFHWTNPSDGDVDHVNVYFSLNHAYTGSVIQQVAAVSNTTGEATIEGLSNGTTYYFYLSTVDVTGNESAFTTELKRTTASTADTTSPAAVPSFTAVDLATGGTVKLVWTTPADDDFFQVHIHRANTSEFTPVSGNEIAAVFGLPSSVIEYSDIGLVDGTTYYYKARTEDNVGNVQSGLFYPSASATPTLVESQQPEEPQEPEAPNLSGIDDGDLIRAEGTLDIYIVKTIPGTSADQATKKFRRLILNPEIFNSYGHLRWEDVQDVPQAVVDAFTTSDLVIEVNADGSIADPKVYKVSSAADSDVGQKQWLDITAAQFEDQGYDWDALFYINHTEASPSFYSLGSPITA